jgi:hypothetical protein
MLSVFAAACASVTPTASRMVSDTCREQQQHQKHAQSHTVTYVMVAGLQE